MRKLPDRGPVAGSAVAVVGAASAMPAVTARATPVTIRRRDHRLGSAGVRGWSSDLPTGMAIHFVENRPPTACGRSRTTRQCYQRKSCDSCENWGELSRSPSPHPDFTPRRLRPDPDLHPRPNADAPFPIPTLPMQRERGGRKGASAVLVAAASSVNLPAGSAFLAGQPPSSVNLPGWSAFQAGQLSRVTSACFAAEA